MRVLGSRQPGAAIGNFVAFVALLLYVAAGARAEGAAGIERVRVATFNLRNYLLVDRVVEGVFRRNYPKPEAEKRALRKVIAAVDPDILAVQEIGGAAFVLELQRDLASLGREFPHTAVKIGADAERRTALLSRLEFRELPVPAIDFPYFGKRETVKRGLFGAVFQTGGVEWYLFNLHLKSRWTVRPDDPGARIRREAESRAIRNYLKERFPGEGTAPYLVLGDFNATRDTLAVRHVLRSGERDLTAAVPAADSRGESWTYFYRRADTYSRVDFLLASPPLFARLVNGEGAVYDGPGAAAASDHRIVYADFEF